MDPSRRRWVIAIPRRSHSILNRLNTVLMKGQDRKSEIDRFAFVGAILEKSILYRPRVFSDFIQHEALQCTQI